MRKLIILCVLMNFFSNHMKLKKKIYFGRLAIMDLKDLKVMGMGMRWKQQVKMKLISEFPEIMFMKLYIYIYIYISIIILIIS